MYIFPEGSFIEQGPDIRINCPACAADGVSASTYNQIDKIHVVIIPFRWRSSWVICSACGRSLKCSRDVAELYDLSEEELGPLISPYVSLVGRTIAMLALLLGWFPFVGPVLAVAAVLANRVPGVWRWMSRAGLVIAVLAHVLYGVAFLLERG
jgi:hypothetical protein